jgi:hypothetical protein
VLPPSQILSAPSSLLFPRCSRWKAGLLAGLLLFSCFPAQAQDFFSATGVGGGFAAFDSTPRTVGEEDFEGEADLASGILGASLATLAAFDYAVSLRAGYDTNPNTSSINPQESPFAFLGINVGFGRQMPRFLINSNLNLGATAYTAPGTGDRNRFNGTWALSSLYTFSPRLVIGFNTRTGYFSQPNLGVSGTSAFQEGNYITHFTSLSATYQWASRFSFTTSYSLGFLYYEQQQRNDQQGRYFQTISLALNYIFRPTTILVTEYRLSPTNYFVADLDSVDQFLLLGFDHVFSPRSSWTLRGGLQYNVFNNPIDGRGTYAGPYVESSFLYRFGDISQMSFTLRYGTEASGQTNVSQRQTLRAGLGLVYGLTPRLRANLGLFYSVNYYDQVNVIPSYSEYIAEGALGLSYALNQYFSANIDYRITSVTSTTNFGQEYDRSILSAGFTFSF